jgi:hypothetical protein
MARVISNSGLRSSTSGWPADSGLDLDEVAKAQGLVLAAVLHQHVEIGIHQRGLVAVRDLERRCLDAEFLVGLLLGGGVLGRVDELHAHIAAGGDRVLAQQVAQLGYQRREQRV